MRYLNLSGVETNVSRVAFGMANAWANSSVPANELLDMFIAGGGTTIDTARDYGGGQADLALGRWLAGRPRESVVIIGKGCHPLTPGTPRMRPEVLHAEITETLEALGTDFIDIFLLHRDDRSQPVDAIVEALNEERQLGRLRAFGASNWSVDRIAEANAYADSHGLTPFTVNSPGWSLGTPNEDMWPDCVYVDAAIRQWHLQNQMPMLAWSAQASGFFSGRYAAGDGQSSDVTRVYYNDINFARLERARLLAQSYGVGSNEIALAYVLNQPFPTAAVVSARTQDQLAKILKACELVLSADEVAELEMGPTDRPI